MGVEFGVEVDRVEVIYDVYVEFEFDVLVEGGLFYLV